MSEKPILFNTEMVMAIREGRKTQTRRVVKDFAGERITSVLEPDGSYGKYGTKGWRGMLPDRGDGNEYCIEVRPPCELDDILWVRETWRPIEASSAGWCRIEYKAGGTEDFQKVIAVPKYREPWHPSIHMPKEAARIFLRVKEVRLERLQDITDDDAKREGCSCFYGNTSMVVPETMNFIRIWNNTIKPADIDKYSFLANPWVWVIEFERCEKPEGWPQCR